MHELPVPPPYAVELTAPLGPVLLEMARLHLVRVHQTDSGEVLLYRTTREPQQDDLEAIPG